MARVWDVRVAYYRVVLTVCTRAQGMNRAFGTPKITGYLLAGVAFGAHGFGALTRASMQRLWAIDNGCLACIGLAAGAEVIAGELRKNARRTTVTIAAIVAFTWGLTFASFATVFAARVEFLQGLSQAHVYAVSSLTATLALARSPASALAVMTECEASGPFCSHILSATVVKDVLVVAMFAMNVELVALSGLDFHKIVAEAAVGAVGRDGDNASAATTSSAARALLVVLRPAMQLESARLGAKVLQPLVRVLGAVAAGYVSGLVLGRMLRPSSVIARWKNVRVGCICVSAACTFIASEHLGLEPLLVCVAAGVTAANRKHATGEAEREELRAAVHAISPAVNLFFFTLAGASLKLENVWNSLVIAVGLVTVRLFALFCATSVAARVLKAPKVSEITGEKRRNVEWMAHVTQAGVALGLARTVAARFPYWGPAFSTLAVANIVINLFIGPVLFRHSIEVMNESHSSLHAALARVSSGADASPQDAVL